MNCTTYSKEIATTFTNTKCTYNENAYIHLSHTVLHSHSRTSYLPKGSGKKEEIAEG